MQTVHDLLENAKAVDFSYEIPLSLINSREEYLELQREQTKSGERSDGRPIFNIKTGSVTYSPGYAKKKGKLTPIDLYDKGDFSNAMFMDVEGDRMIVDSADSKSAKLQENYSEAIFPLGDKRMPQFTPVAQTNLINGVTNQLNK